MPDYSYRDRTSEIIRDQFIAAGFETTEQAEARRSALREWQARPNARVFVRLSLWFVVIVAVSAGVFAAASWLQAHGMESWDRGLLLLWWSPVLGLSYLWIAGGYGFRYARSEWRRRTGSVPK